MFLKLPPADSVPVYTFKLLCWDRVFSATCDAGMEEKPFCYSSMFSRWLISILKTTWITKLFFFSIKFNFMFGLGNYCCSAWQCQYINYLFSFAIFPVGLVSQHYNHLWMLEMMIIIFPFLCLFVHCTHFKVISWTFLLFSHRHCFLGKRIVKMPN